MRMRFAITAAILSLPLLFPAPGQAAVLLVGGQEGTTDPPSPTEGAETEEDWNPIVTCSIPPGGEIFDLLECLLDNIATPPPPCLPWPIGTGDGSGFENLTKEDPSADCSDPDSRQDFYVTLVPLPYYGVEIRRLDGSEIDRIALRENDPGIQTTELRNERPDRVARIRQIEETPQGGSIHLVIDDVSVNVSLHNGRFPTVPKINAEVIRQIRAGGLSLGYLAPYFYVRNHTRLPYGVHVVQFRSTDPGITRSDLSLLPEGDPAIPLAVATQP